MDFSFTGITGEDPRSTGELQTLLLSGHGYILINHVVQRGDGYGVGQDSVVSIATTDVHITQITCITEAKGRDAHIHFISTRTLDRDKIERSKIF